MSLPSTSASQSNDRLAVHFAHILSGESESIGIDIYILTYAKDQRVLRFEVAGEQVAELPLRDVQLFGGGVLRFASLQQLSCEGLSELAGLQVNAHVS
jgi:hypothetical protein